MRKVWIRFDEAPPRGNTKTWWVREIAAAVDGPALGIIKWFAPWRRYAFFPATGSLFESECLQNIAGFCNGHTLDRKSVWRKRE